MQKRKHSVSTKLKAIEDLEAGLRVTDVPAKFDVDRKPIRQWRNMKNSFIEVKASRQSKSTFRIALGRKVDLDIETELLDFFSRLRGTKQNLWRYKSPGL